MGIGLVVSVWVNPMVQLCFATEVRGSARPTLGKREDAGGGVSLIGFDVSSLVIDTLCKQAVEEKAAVACFYLDFATQEEQSAAAILDSVLKRIVGGLGEALKRIVKAFRNREKVVGS